MVSETQQLMVGLAPIPFTEPTGFRPDYREGGRTASHNDIRGVIVELVRVTELYGCPFTVEQLDVIGEALAGYQRHEIQVWEARVEAEGKTTYAMGRDDAVNRANELFAKVAVLLAVGDNAKAGEIVDRGWES